VLERRTETVKEDSSPPPFDKFLIPFLFFWGLVFFFWGAVWLWGSVLVYFVGCLGGGGDLCRRVVVGAVFSEGVVGGVGEDVLC